MGAEGMMHDQWDAELEWKLRHVRTPEGARYYNKPIGSPITAADRIAARSRKRPTGGGSNGGGSEPKPAPERPAGRVTPNPKPRITPTPDKPAPKARITPTKPAGGAQKPAKRVPGLAAADGPQNRERRSQPVTPDTKTVRPQLYTYQRNNVIKLGLSDSKDKQVREAALRVEERRPLTAEQSSALADALREQSKTDGVKPAQQRAMKRSAQSFDAAAARVKGEEYVPESMAGKKPQKTPVADMTEGDTVIIPDGRGGAIAGRIEMNERLMGGRLHRVAITGEDGTLSFHLVDPKGTSYLLPDASAPKIVPDETPAPDPEVMPDVEQQKRDRARQERANMLTETLSNIEEDVVRNGFDAAIPALFAAMDSSEKTSDEEKKKRVADAIREAGKKAQETNPFVTMSIGLSLVDRNAEGDSPEDQIQRNETTMTALRDSTYKTATEDFARAVENIETIDGENIGNAVGALLHSYKQNGPTRNWGAVSENTLRISELLRESEPKRVEEDLTVAPSRSGASLKARMSKYRDALPSGTVGKVRVEIDSYGDLDVEALERGEIPKPTKRIVARADLAEDFGPGETTMRHLDVVMAAGAELEAELLTRIKARMIDRELATEEDDPTEIDRRLGEPTQAALKKYRDLHANNASTLDIQEAANEYWRNKRLHASFHKAYATERAAAAKELLSEVRPLGGAKFKFLTEEGKPRKESESLVQDMRKAESIYPTDWLKAAKNRQVPEDQAGTIRLWQSERGGYSERNRSIMLSGQEAQIEGATDFESVAIHELGHEMERSIPGLLEMEYALLWSRTSAGDIGSRTRTGVRSEIDGMPTYEDEFRISYTGKVYAYGLGGFTTEEVLPDSMEVFTTQVESIFGGSSYEDENLRRWTLGALALL